MATLLDWGNVDAAAAQIESSLGLERRSEAFTLLCLASLLRLDFDEVRGCVTDGAEDRGVDAVYLDERFGRRVVHLFQMKCHARFNGSKRNFPSSEIDKLLAFLSDCFGQVDGFLDTCNPLLREKVLDIWAFVESGACEVQVHLCSNGEKLIDDQKARFEASLVRFKFIKLQETDLDALSDAVSHRASTDRTIQLRVVEEQLFERTDGNVRAVIGTMRADEFISALADEKNTNQLDPICLRKMSGSTLASRTTSINGSSIRLCPMRQRCFGISTTA